MAVHTSAPFPLMSSFSSASPGGNYCQHCSDVTERSQMPRRRSAIRRESGENNGWMRVCDHWGLMGGGGGCTYCACLCKGSRCFLCMQYSYFEGQFYQKTNKNMYPHQTRTYLVYWQHQQSFGSDAIYFIATHRCWGISTQDLTPQNRGISFVPHVLCCSCAVKMVIPTAEDTLTCWCLPDTRGSASLTNPSGAERLIDKVVIQAWQPFSACARGFWGFFNELINFVFKLKIWKQKHSSPFSKYIIQAHTHICNLNPIIVHHKCMVKLCILFEII